jgi:tetratricopeptide (TPR) repeat protein
MRYTLATSLLFTLRLLASGGDHGANAGKAPLLDNLGNHHHPITTSSRKAQQYFDQGLTLCYAFNHAEAIRSFREAAKLDANCAMANWGIAFASGPHVNLPMSDEAVPIAYGALQKALELARSASPKEQAYIEALAKRYVEKPDKDRKALDHAFADAMRQLVMRYPEDLDAATILAESLMDKAPWDYWGPDGKPKGDTEQILTTLESVLRRNPDHPGACHYYIHAVEASPRPERGLPAAHRLRFLVPGAGHLVHMPAHIYLRVGDYPEAVRCNERAVAADEDYIRRYRVKGTYAAMYYPHNVHFLWYTLALQGRGGESIRQGRKVARLITRDALNHMPSAHWLHATPVLALARFGRWNQVLQEPQPPAEDLYETAMWHYARGLALVRQRQPEKAQAEAADLEKLAQDKGIEALEVPDFPGASLTRLANRILAAELAGLRDNTERRIRGLEEAVGLQDKLPYMEPPYWYFPVRQGLGAALVQAGRYAEAEKAYHEDLKRQPENGWSLFGLLQCLRARGDTEAALGVEKRFRDAWKNADVALTTSWF